MIASKQPVRSLIAFLVTWAFAVLTVTGLVLYVVPQGRIAYWVHWSLLGMSKEQWGAVHMIFGGIFIVTGVLHLYFNWRPFKKYLAERAKGRLRVKRELVLSVGLTVLVFALSVLELPPASWVLDLNDTVKDAWVTSPDLEPPYGHAEESSLAGLCKRMDLDVAAAKQRLTSKGIRFRSERDSLEQIARANGATPMAVYGLIRDLANAPSGPPQGTAPTPEAVEARYTGTGLGRKDIAAVARQIGIDPAIAIERLAEAGIGAGPDDNLRQLAQAHGLSPIDLMKVLVIPGHRPDD